MVVRQGAVSSIFVDLIEVGAEEDSPGRMAELEERSLEVAERVVAAVAVAAYEVGT